VKVKSFKLQLLVYITILILQAICVKTQVVSDRTLVHW